MATSRRDLLKLGLASGAALAVPIAAGAQAPTAESVEKDLGHSLSEEAKRLLPQALNNNRNNGIERLKTPLPECSEPCFVYRVTGVRK